MYNKEEPISEREYELIDYLFIFFLMKLIIYLYTLRRYRNHTHMHNTFLQFFISICRITILLTPYKTVILKDAYKGIYCAYSLNIICKHRNRIFSKSSQQMIYSHIFYCIYRKWSNLLLIIISYRGHIVTDDY